MIPDGLRVGRDDSGVRGSGLQILSLFHVSAPFWTCYATGSGVQMGPDVLREPQMATDGVAKKIKANQSEAQPSLADSRMSGV